MNKNKYLIALDLDGTLFMNFKEYDIKSTEYLKKIKKDNIIVIATGRPFRSSEYYRKIIGLDTPIINYNGALIHNPDDLNFIKHEMNINRESLFSFINDNKDIIINYFCEIGDDIYVPYIDDMITPFLHLDGGIVHIGDLCTNLKSNPNGALIFLKKGSEEQINNYVANKYNGEIKVRFWVEDKFIICELYNRKVSKGNALKIISEYYNIPNDRIIAIGDGHNDIEMITYAKYGVAMANSHPDLLKNAKYHTKSVFDAGVYDFLFNLFETKKKHND